MDREQQRLFDEAVDRQVNQATISQQQLDTAVKQLIFDMQNDNHEHIVTDQQMTRATLQDLVNAYDAILGITEDYMHHLSLRANRSHDND